MPMAALERSISADGNEIAERREVTGSQRRNGATELVETRAGRTELRAVRGRVATDSQARTGNSQRVCEPVAARPLYAGLRPACGQP